MKVSLNFNPAVPIKVYQHHAYTLGILLNSEKEYMWLYNNYIQLAFTKSLGWDSFNFYMDYITHQPVFTREHLSDSLLKSNHIKALDYIFNALNEGKYVLACVDEFYIPNRRAYQKFNYVHDILIYGYDDELMEFEVAGYDDRMNYSITKVPYKNMELSKPQYIDILSVNSKYPFEMNIKSILLQLKQYINEIDNLLLGDMYRSDRTYGIEACLDILDMYKEEFRLNHLCDIRPIYLLVEHKECMYKRIELINKIYNIKPEEDYYYIVEGFLILKNLLLKYNYTQSDRSIDVFVEKFHKYIMEEKRYLNTYISLVSNLL
ncbi:hypothetical protein acsn021_29070 [Anaerocolumna cellulosilytica]|uniref:Uncharacterized protein n=1 Tax=Anaerocolumna cellulosilytica TaxID=433286 RepID=A0A6S6R8P2_9FIRM|nr:hypothetical protein [Anaerocolumna cellulosilytica]MBB5197125.1 hypothetical protein [Anaerocolumna cellulosilytica]BCJ95338.1 hypothetical protein acsn021_29070 [Anaerocolumna cellulosilytica]